MELNDLIHKIEKARTKDDLEALGIEHLNIDVDKRKAKEVLRAELLGEAELRLPSESPGSGMANPHPTPEPTPEPAKSEPEQPAPKLDMKMGRNRKTGRVMPWTAAMVKMPHMEEV